MWNVWIKGCVACVAAAVTASAHADWLVSEQEAALSRAAPAMPEAKSVPVPGAPRIVLLQPDVAAAVVSPTRIQLRFEAPGDAAIRPETFKVRYGTLRLDITQRITAVSTVTPQVFSLFNGQSSYDRALALANRVLKEKATDPISRVFELTFGRKPSTDEIAACTTHWQQMEVKQAQMTFSKPKPPLEVRREAVEENTGEKFSFQEKLPGYADFVPDLQPADCDVRTRALADVCLVLLNSNEFAYLY